MRVYKIKAVVLWVGAIIWGGSAALLGEPDGGPPLSLHLGFEPANWVAHAAGCADCFAAKPTAVPGRFGAGALIESPEQSGVVETPLNLDKARGTLTLWYQPTVALEPKGYHPLAWSGESDDKGSNSLWLWIYDGSLRFDVRDPGDCYCTVPLRGWKPGEWVHIAAAWDCDKGLSLWINGQKEKERATTWKPAVGSPLRIGTGNSPCEGRAAGGVLDELKVFRRPLTESEVRAEFENRLPYCPVPTASREQMAAARKSPPQREREPLRTLFHLDFESGFVARQAGGKGEPTNANLPALVKGRSGQAAQFGLRQVLRYPEEGNLRKECGAVAVWIQTPVEGNDAKEWLHIFREEGPNQAGSNALWLWLYPKHGLRWDPRDEADSHSIVSSSAAWKKGEWHHVVACWDAFRGTTVWVDGKLRSFGSSGDSGKKFIPICWDPVSYPAFLIGADGVDGNRPWQGAIDEFKIFSRPLTQEEVGAEYGRFCPVPVEITALDPYLWAGEMETLTLSLENLQAATVQAGVSYRLRNSGGAAIAEGSLGEQTIAALARRHLPVKLRLPAKGSYALDIRVTTAHGLKETSVAVYGLSRTGPAEEGKPAWIPVAELDPTALRQVVESAPSRVIDSPLGPYREAGSGRNDRFALLFRVKEPHVPHVAVVTYPDDKPRSMEVMLQPLDSKLDYQAQTGVFTGDEYPVSGSLKEQRIVFWPQGEAMSLVFMTVEKGRPAAVQGLRILKQDGGFPRLPVKPFEGSLPAREIGLYHEDPVIADCYGTVPGEPDMHFFPGFETVIDRMLDYHQWFGVSSVHYPVSWYQGPLFGSEAEPLTGYGGRPHPLGYPKYLMRRLEARGMTFNGWLHLHQIDSLLPYTITDDERVRDGEETVINMRSDNRLFYRAWHGRDPVYNPLDPHVQAAVKRQIEEIVERYGAEPAFTGLTLNTVRHSIFAFGSLASGYNDGNLAAFQRETGIRIPVETRDRYRFAKSSRWLMEHAREPWIQWRCRRLHDYYKELAAVLRAKRPELTLGLVVFAAESAKATADYLQVERPVLQDAREQGIDPALYENDPELVFRYSMVPADLRWKRAHGVTDPAVSDLRTVNSAPEMVAPLARTPAASVNMHDRYFENDVAREQPLPLPGKTRECPWRVSALNGGGIHGLENHVFALNNLDALAITKGGFLVGTLGIEESIGRFAQAFRALPAVKFQDVAGLADPVRVRQREVDGANYFYLLNRLPYPVEAELRLAGAEAVDLVGGEKFSQESGVRVTLRPYELRSFRQSGANSRVRGGSSSIPKEVSRDLADRLASVEATLRGQKGPVGESTPYLEQARKCRDAKEYARLYFLLQERWTRSR